MKNIIKSLIAFAILLTTSLAFAQIKNSKTETLKVYGNCGMCKTKIEKAGTQKNISKTIWNEKSGMATISYDTKKTNTDAILKRIALVGYDSDSFLAPDNVYENLHGCCQYDRPKKTKAKETTTVSNNTEVASKASTPTNQIISQTQAIYNNYFALKDALVKTDATATASQAAALLATLNAVDMAKMKIDEHMAFMKVQKALKADATTIGISKDVTVQRAAFSNLSTNIIELAKVAKPTETAFVQHCPMYNDGAGANWLSKENAVKNPYYGSMMLTCGKTTETIK